MKFCFCKWVQLGLNLALGAFLLSGATSSIASDVKTVDRIDLLRYQGKWHEIASLPQFFQRECTRDTVADYSQLPSNEIKVENVCVREDGSRKKAEGRARLYDSSETAKLSVTFLQLFGDYRYWAGGDYWVIELDPAYGWAVVGHPSRKYGWVLSRTPSLPVNTLAEIVGRIKAQGYDACEFIVTPQTGGLTIKRPLCNAIQ